MMSAPHQPTSSNIRVTYPAEHVVQVTINRPKVLNCLDNATSHEIELVWDMLDQEESLWVGIITGSGRAFCTGADLQEWSKMNQDGIVNDMSAPGLAGLSRRSGKKPIIAAVNGICMGGGTEMITNCDYILASSTAIFALPEAKRGIVPVAGCLPRLSHTIGLQRTMDLVLTGRSVTAHTLHDWGLVNRVVEAGDDVAAAAVQVAQRMCDNSPDALIIGRMGVRMGWERGDVEGAVSELEARWYPRLMEGENFAEGIKAFVEKRKPRWVGSKL